MPRYRLVSEMDANDEVEGFDETDYTDLHTAMAAALATLGYGLYDAHDDEAETVPKKYRMNDAIWEHLTTWCRYETRTEAEAEELRNKMVGSLEALDPIDAEYSISHGWAHVRDLL